METFCWRCPDILSELNELEERIDKAIEEGDLEGLLKLLNEREELLKSLPEETLEAIQRKDEERLRKLEEMREGFLRELVWISAARESLLRNIREDGETIGRV